MAIKIKIPKSSGKSSKGIRGLPRDPVIRAALIVFLVVAIGVGGFLCYFYIKYDRIIEQRFRTPVFSNSAKIYALPRTVHDGEKVDVKEIAASLRRAGAVENITTGATDRSRRFGRAGARAPVPARPGAG